MQIVIDIDDNTYTHLFDGGMEIVPQVGEILLAVKNGKPLPKGHGALKDIDAIMREVSVVSYRPVKSQMYIIKQAPTIIEADIYPNEQKEFDTAYSIAIDALKKCKNN